MIPADAALSAQSNLYPHVAHRRKAYLFPTVDDAEYVFVDVTSTPYPVDVSKLNTEIQHLLEHGEFGVVKAQDGYLLLRRGATGGLSGDAWRAFLTFAQADRPPARPTAIRFGDSLELVGFDGERHNVVTAGQLPATVTTYWRALQPLTADYEISFYFTRQDGAIVGSYEDALPALAWRPTRAWQPGEIVRVETPVLPIGRDRGVLVGVRRRAQRQATRRTPVAGSGRNRRHRRRSRPQAHLRPPAGGAVSIRPMTGGSRMITRLRTHPTCQNRIRSPGGPMRFHDLRKPLVPRM